MKQTADQPGDLTTIFASDLLINGPTTDSSGRLFACVQPQDGQSIPQVVELVGSAARPYPDTAWNSGEASQDADTRFVGVNSLRVGPDSALWAVDRGAPGAGAAPVFPHPKLVRMDLQKNAVSRVYSLAEVTNEHSFVDDVRFHGPLAYLTDAGWPGLIVLDLRTGAARRVLDGAPSVTAQRPLLAEGRQLRDPAGQPVVIHADQLEVSPDGRWLYFQPCCGLMSRVETRWLDDPDLPPEQLAAQVTFFADTPPTGGTAMSASGDIYLSDVNRLRLLRIRPDGHISELLADDRLSWVDAMWIDDAGRLLMPAAQLNRTASLNAGVSAVEPPIRLYALPIGARPFRS